MNPTDASFFEGVSSLFQAKKPGTTQKKVHFKPFEGVSERVNTHSS
jgi:hypothetical protein